MLRIITGKGGNIIDEYEKWIYLPYAKVELSLVLEKNKLIEKGLEDSGYDYKKEFSEINEKIKKLIEME